MTAPSLLVVEDDPTNLKLLLLFLSSLFPDASVTGVSDGEDAVSLARRKRFDLVLMDCMLPGISGFAATSAIREEGSACQRVPIVAITAGLDGDEEERCERAGIDELVTKPYTLDVLKLVVSRWLQQDRPI
ncbi:MAG: response regulator [Myxococcales bacterium]|nr:response regulator [Myxococcales bacterium]